ncbi:DUF72 domain-containing protein [Arthrobacter caoxuetaonis]|uniref:DUF72 domain-containing protein n=1 Tax=Arthrobacter caoxuetaonis TaxID=2886935 RepID=A0A9X1MCG4_9MICC|nr:DUF72 domain-containing protein [Arthrobacter caoxuetaonis]MCC3297413.1 DUF72 domain-containing protein [Arthrobacter caoxuetaonis]USQ58054.1 DUF72 domain-containing protein [Arthrobacter caoxuetaonis]
MSRLRIGTSGWTYNHWRRQLYPAGLPAGKWLEYYAGHFDTVEFNGSFYRWPREEAFARYRDRLPQDFEFSVKAPRGLTHARKLREPEVWIGRIARCWKELGSKAGVLLLQLPPDMERDDARLAAVLSALPDSIRVAVEFRHDTWNQPGVFDLLAKHNAAYCVMSGARLPCILEATADFVYVRLHGPDHHTLYAGSYSEADLRWWAERIREWRAGGRDVYAYFNNDGEGAAVHNARRLGELLS